MSEIVFLVHLPLLRTAAETVPFGSGDLWQLPFDHFDRLTAEAFSKDRSRYEAAAPVFYRVVMDVSWPFLNRDTQNVEPGKTSFLQLKLGDFEQTLKDTGLGFLLRFHELFVTPAWQALLLAAPAAALPAPRLSTAFVIADPGEYFHIGGRASRTIQVQGDADLELCFFAEGAGPPLPGEVLAAASALLPHMERLLASVELRAALQALEFATSVVLSPSEQLTLCVIALEALLQPEVRARLGATFAARLSRVLGADETDRQRLRQIASLLYKLRSTNVHGGHAGLEQAAVSAYAQQLLAAAVLALDRCETPVALLRAGLDDPNFAFAGSAGPVPEVQPAGLRRGQRFLRVSTEQTSILLGPGETLRSEEGTLLCWAPLVGLGLDSEFQLGAAGSPLVLGFSGTELLSMEDRDVRRDFVSRLSMSEEAIAVLAISQQKEDGTSSPDGPDFGSLLRRRDLAVVALRLAGFTSFHDPELLGLFGYDGSIRHRRGSVYRQSLLHDLLYPPQARIGAADKPLTESPCRLLAQYDAEARHEDVDAVLTLFRRTFDQRFQPVNARLGFLCSTLETLLGRFRPWGEKVQLEDLVGQWVEETSPAALWFRREGRAFRNLVAHGHSFSAEETVDPARHMAAILQTLVPAFVRCWVQADRNGDRPISAFVRHSKEAFLQGKTP